MYIWPGKYYILNTDFILHSLVCVAIDANNRNMDIMVFICCQASHLVRSVPIITNVSLQLLTSRLWAATGTEGDTADSLPALQGGARGGGGRGERGEDTPDTAASCQWRPAQRLIAGDDRIDFRL